MTPQPVDVSGIAQTIATSRQVLMTHSLCSGSRFNPAGLPCCAKPCGLYRLCRKNGLVLLLTRDVDDELPLEYWQNPLSFDGSAGFAAMSCFSLSLDYPRPTCHGPSIDLNAITVLAESVNSTTGGLDCGRDSGGYIVWYAGS